MPYRKLSFRADQYYHLYNRGVNRQPIFFERENYLFFLRKLREYLVPTTIDVIAYCLMPTHYHLLVYLRTDDLSRPMQRWLLSYTKAVNKRHQRIGSLFQGRFQAVSVDTDAYLLHLSRYIHLNPVLAGLAQHPEEWEFSSYREYVGLRPGTLPRAEVILNLLGSVRAYQDFVASYADAECERIRHLTME